MGKSLPLQPLPVALWCAASKMLPGTLLLGIHAHVSSFPPQVREWPGPSDVPHNSTVHRQDVPSEIGSPKEPSFHPAGPLSLSHSLPRIQAKLWATLWRGPHGEERRKATGQQLARNNKKRRLPVQQLARSWILSTTTKVILEVDSTQVHSCNENTALDNPVIIQSINPWLEYPTKLYLDPHL